MHAYGHADTPPIYQHQPPSRLSDVRARRRPIFSAVKPSPTTLAGEMPPSRTAVCAWPARPKVFARIDVYLRMNERGPPPPLPDLRWTPRLRSQSRDRRRTFWSTCADADQTEGPGRPLRSARPDLHEGEGGIAGNVSSFCCCSATSRRADLRGAIRYGRLGRTPPLKGGLPASRPLSGALAGLPVTTSPALRRFSSDAR
jgi:hypothetical protein